MDVIEATTCFPSSKPRSRVWSRTLRLDSKPARTSSRAFPSPTWKEVFRRNVVWRGISRGLAGQLYGAGKGDQYRETVLHSTLPFAAKAVILVVKNKTASRWKRICIYAIAGAACSLAILFFLK